MSTTWLHPLPPGRNPRVRGAADEARMGMLFSLEGSARWAGADGVPVGARTLKTA